jgi:hypothetical protein
MTGEAMANQDDKHSPQVERLLGPRGYEIGCDECFERLDEYVELELAGADANERIPGLRNHLEEHASLLALALQDRRDRTA